MCWILRTNQLKVFTRLSFTPYLFPSRSGELVLREDDQDWKGKWCGMEIWGGNLGKPLHLWPPHPQAEHELVLRWGRGDFLLVPLLSAAPTHAVLLFNCECSQTPRRIFSRWAGRFRGAGEGGEVRSTNSLPFAVQKAQQNAFITSSAIYHFLKKLKLFTKRALCSFWFFFFLPGRNKNNRWHLDCFRHNRVSAVITEETTIKEHSEETTFYKSILDK